MRDGKMITGSKDWADVVLQMRQAAVDRFNARRNLEWKLSLALWGGVGVAANVLRETAITRAERNWLIFGGLLVIVVHGVWQWYYFARGAPVDRDDGINLDQALRKHVPDVPPLPNDPPLPYRRAVAHYAQVAITVALVAFAVFMIPELDVAPTVDCVGANCAP